jgi:hypothetical protein
MGRFPPSHKIGLCSWSEVFMRNIVSAQRHFVLRRARGDVLDLGYFDIPHNRNSGALAPFTRAGTFRQTSYLEAVFVVHGETREYFQ